MTRQEQLKAASRRWYANLTPDEKKEKQRKERERAKYRYHTDAVYKEQTRINRKKSYWKHREKRIKEVTIYSSAYRDQCYMHYGNICGCCGETNLKFLTIDHVNNDGKEHRKVMKRHICKWLVDNNYPVGFQLWCYNCNLGKNRNKGICPHVGPDLMGENMETETVEIRDKFRYLVTCPCGLSRCLPQDINPGDSFSLVSCTRCGATMVGTFNGEGVVVK